MRNTIKYYYNINPKEIHQINKKYKFKINSKEYIFCQCKRNMNELIELYKLQIYLKRYGVYSHEIILNKNKEIITVINGIQYILLRMDVENRKINIKDIYIISNIKVNPNEYESIKRKNWYELWINKIDYIEYQVNQFKKKYKIINESIDYYIGIVENSITLLSTCNYKNQIYTISHNRIRKETTTEDFYNPINFIIDNRLRNISEYIKSDLLKENMNIDSIKEYMYYSKFDTEEIKIFFARLLYPSDYLDKYEEIIEKRLDENRIISIIEKNTIYEHNIKKIYNYLRCISELPEIEWLL